jgi:hypothetical protein
MKTLPCAAGMYHLSTLKPMRCLFSTDVSEIGFWESRLHHLDGCHLMGALISFNKTGLLCMNPIDFFYFWCLTPLFSNISAILWRPVLVVEKAGVPAENHRPWASNW